MIFKIVKILRTESDEMVLMNNYQDLQNIKEQMQKEIKKE